MTLGAVTKTDVTMMYIHGLAPEETLQEFRKKLHKSMWILFWNRDTLSR